MQPKGMEDLATFGAKKLKSATTKVRKTSFLLQKDNAHSKVTPTSYLEIIGRSSLIEAIEWKKRNVKDN